MNSHKFFLNDDIKCHPIQALVVHVLLHDYQQSNLGLSESQLTSWCQISLSNVVI